jgi:UDPglucose 6-dehydrogenase
MDTDVSKVERLARGEPTILEKGLPELLREGIEAGRLSFTTDVSRAVEGAGFVFLCVPTPQGQDGSADTSAIEAASRAVSPHLATGAVVVNKSTVPIGSTVLVEGLLGRGDIPVVSNPEFLREGSAVHDSLHPERIVVGGEDRDAAARVGSLFAATHAPLIVTDPATAETIKYASNAFLATKLSFVNAVAGLCEAVGADVRDVLLGMGYDHRIGFDYLRPGPGWGGSCLPKDTRALVRLAEDAGYDFSFVRDVIAINDAHRERVIDKVRDAAGGSLAGCRIAVWGLTFKAATDDLRDSPAVTIVQRIVGEGATVRVYDPTVEEVPRELWPSEPSTGTIEISRDPYDACSEACVLAVLTEWDELRWLDFAKVREQLAEARIVDARNLLDPAQIRRLGYSYVGIGRP